MRQRLTIAWLTVMAMSPPPMSGARAAEPYAPPPLRAGVLATLDLEAGFAPPPDARRAGMGIRRLSGIALEEINGVHPIYIAESLRGVLANNPLVEGDIVVAVDGRPLGGNPIRQFTDVVRRENQRSGIVWVRRWRNGEMTDQMLDLGSRPLDLTRGATHNPDQEDWALGATGAHGWIWAVPHRTTEGSRQIYITEVEAGSPADGILRVGDVVLGTFGRPFDRDARKEFANALTEAETPERQGRLPLAIWRGGRTMRVTIPLRVMGSYRQTAPFDCPKSARILDRALGHIHDGNGLVRQNNSILANIDALALLATGRREYLPAIRAHAHAVAAPVRELEFRLARETWHWGYANLFLTEYYLATRDEAVLPAIREYATKMALGQSRVGTWGHSMCVPYSFSDGPRHGIAPGYGAMNQASLVCMISMILARECGVEDPRLTEAIERGVTFFRYYVDKGTVPYGDHAPGVGDHDDNGKNSLAAVMFDLLGDEEAATFFTRMTVASFDEREFGHTGNYWSFLWGTLGAARGGDAAAAEFMNRLRWFYDLERRWEGRFEYQGKPGMGNRPDAEHQYKGWDCTGARILAYSLPLKQLRITGRGPGAVGILDADALAETVSAGELSSPRVAELPTPRLLELLGSWSPIVRRRAAIALQARPDDVVSQLIALLEDDRRYARYGAVEGLRHAGRASEAAADALIAKGLASDDPTLRYYAMHAFTLPDPRMGLSAVANRAVPTLLDMAAAVDPADSLRRTQQDLGAVLFSSRDRNWRRSVFMRGEGIEAADRERLISAIRALLKTPNGWIRSSVAESYHALTREDLAQLWPDILEATLELAPSGIMFASEVRTQGLRLMAEHRLQEGLSAAVSYLRNQKGHGSERRTKDVLNLIVESYGGHARPYIPELERTARYFEQEEQFFPAHLSRQKAEDVRAAIRQIEAARTPSDPLIPIAEWTP